jgi:hypothetical protein
MNRPRRPNPPPRTGPLPVDAAAFLLVEPCNYSLDTGPTGRLLWLDDGAQTVRIYITAADAADRLRRLEAD